MDSVPATPPGFQVVEFSGPSIIANLLHWGLFGTLSIQLYLYYLAFPNDKSTTKCLVYIVYIIELVQTILITHDAFATFGYGFGDVAALSKLNFGWLTITIMGALVSFIGQSFYAYRLYLVSGSWFSPTFIMLFSLTSSIGGFLSAIFSFEARNTVQLITRKTSAAAGVWLGGSALSDIIIAVFMTYYLSKNDTGFRQTRVLLSKLIRLTIETNALTALATLTTLALFYVFPNKNYYFTPGILIPKLYANTIFAVLNSRLRILGGRETYISSTDMLSTPSYLSETDAGPIGNGSGLPQFVTIHREVLSDANSQDHVELKGMGV
ncbi:hypothetical protein C8R44DRAFT_705136 [Mycena epipterygia]|nr:hypothetical protein C8R44DRAFT_705136 [Mycena epipterygia]